MNFASYESTTVTWDNYPKSIQVHTKSNNIILKIGDCIIYDTREYPVRIDKFAGKDDAPGPMGFEYLPWRGDRWATPTFGLRGNPRFIICPPTGLPHYGQHINWDTLEIVSNPHVLPDESIQEI
jgi:hypothetical protein